MHPVAVVVDDVVGAEAAQVVVVVGACGCDDPCAAGLSDLHDEGPDTTRGARDEHGLAGADVEMVVETLDRGHTPDGGCACRFEIESVGHHGDEPGIHRGVLGVAARHRPGRAEHRIADAVLGTVAGRAHDPGDLVPGDVRKVAGSVQALTQLDVPGTDAGTGDLDEELSGAGARGGDLGRDEHGRGSELRHGDRSHSNVNRTSPGAIPWWGSPRDVVSSRREGHPGRVRTRGRRGFGPVGVGQHRRRLLMTRHARPLPVLSDAPRLGAGDQRESTGQRSVGVVGSADGGSAVVSAPRVLARVGLVGQVPDEPAPPATEPPGVVVVVGHRSDPLLLRCCHQGNVRGADRVPGPRR